MPYLIDGHNLIGAMPDIHLDALDDEEQLIKRLQAFGARRRKAMTVFFDQRAPGQRKTWRVGKVTARFVSPPLNADQAIKRQLQRLRGEARNYTVVSSDHEVRAAAQQAGARAMSSQAFIQELALPKEETEAAEKPQPSLDEAEIEAWQALFKRSRKDQQP